MKYIIPEIANTGKPTRELVDIACVDNLIVPFQQCSTRARRENTTERKKLVQSLNKYANKLDRVVIGSRSSRIIGNFGSLFYHRGFSQAVKAGWLCSRLTGIIESNAAAKFG